MNTRKTFRLFTALSIFAGLATFAGCTPEGRGFKLPDGDIASGKATFVDLACNDCHSVADIEQAAGSDSGLNIRLGQPVEVEGKSAMRPYNEVMTVDQLVNLVAFLESVYELRVPPGYL
jgi:mono/diheme cytochrome c family protein